MPEIQFITPIAGVKIHGMDQGLAISYSVRRCPGCRTQDSSRVRKDRQLGVAFDISRKTTTFVGGNLKEVKTQVKEILGTWKLVSCEHRLKDGGVHFPLGKDPIGQLIYSPEGFMSVSLMKSGRTLFKTPGLFEGSTSEKAAAAESYVSYAGRYEIRSDKVIHSVELSLFPNWVGSTQERFFKFEQGKLLLHTQPFAMDGKEQVAYLIWEKAT